MNAYERVELPVIKKILSNIFNQSWTYGNNYNEDSLGLYTRVEFSKLVLSEDTAKLNEWVMRSFAEFVIHTNFNGNKIERYAIFIRFTDKIADDLPYVALSANDYNVVILDKKSCPNIFEGKYNITCYQEILNKLAVPDYRLMERETEL